MKKVKLISLIFLLAIILFPNFSYATENKIMLNEEIIVNSNTISEDSSNDVYLSYTEDVKVININEPGKYTISGNSENTQILVNMARILDKEIELIFENASLSTKDIPTINIYSEAEVDNKCIIKIKEGTNNYISSISSNISLVFDGKGNLKVASNELVGIESKKDINIKDGNIEINSNKNAIKAGKNITVENGFVYANIAKESEAVSGFYAEETIKINNGKVYSLASESEGYSFEGKNGVYINGGTVLGIGTAKQGIKTDNNTTFMELHTQTPIREKESAVLVDDKKETIFACKMDRMCKVFVYTSPDVQKKTFLIYGGSDIKGETDEYSVYTKIERINLENFVKHEDREDPSNPGNMNPRKYTVEEAQKVNRNVKIGIIVLGGVIFIIMAVANGKNKKVNGFVNLFIGIVIGVLIGFGVSQLLIGESLDVTKTKYERETEGQLPEMPDIQGDVPPPGMEGTVPENNPGGNAGGSNPRPNGFNPSSNR